ncbi:hypothetical protein Alches_24800 [Alicyclobacillus hesperidum subsp. aegles]|nr:hypothetical protein Alches_24800 [Alicyclobacillus hesperidum subsp. aegles]
MMTVIWRRNQNGAMGCDIRLVVFRRRKQDAAMADKSNITGAPPKGAPHLGTGAGPSLRIT